MESLVDAYEKLAADEEVEMYKLAEEEAAGRIMARGFMAELQKLAQGPMFPPKTESPIARQSYSMPSAPRAGGGATVRRKQSPLRIAQTRSVPSQAKPAAPAAPARTGVGTSPSSLASQLRGGGGMARGKKRRPMIGGVSMPKKAPTSF